MRRKTAIIVVATLIVLAWIGTRGYAHHQQQYVLASANRGR